MKLTHKSIGAEEFVKLKLERSCYLLDVRNPDEFLACHLPGAINLPLDDIEKGHIQTIPREEAVYLVCQSGIRSDRARRILESQGFLNIICVQGGVAECSKISGAVLKNSSRLPIMRQVLISAGLLVVLGIVCSKIIHPGFIFLSLFVGSGLVFAGVTGICGMALLLEKMPWNRIEKCPSEPYED